jgi:hypothetical protein
MDLPLPEWFSFEMLATRWGVTTEYINSLVRDRKIERHFVPTFDPSIRASIIPQDFFEAVINSEPCIPRDEVLRFEAECEANTASTTNKDTLVEEPKLATGNQPIPDVTGRRESLRILIEDGLVDYKSVKSHFPRHGTAFQDFLNFIHGKLTAKVKPSYMSKCKVIERSGIPSAPCITFIDKGKTTTYNRKYVENRFHQLKTAIIRNSSTLP